tara:strand:+ start:828 stop:1559 length:732 start_codon:yes stop_codon:yes gene_type:complete
MIDLRLGDCLEVMKTIKTGSIDAIITDPPYGTTACKWDSVIDFELMWEQLNRIIKPNGAIVLFGSEPFSSFLRVSNIKNYKYDWVWEKERPTNPQLANKQVLKYHEMILIFYKKQSCYFPILRKREEKNKRNNKPRKFKSGIIGKGMPNSEGMNETGMNDWIKPKSVLKFNMERGLHPTQKPVALMEYLIKTYTQENETVLDFTMGSGSTGVACKNTNRNFIGIEQDEKYFNIAQERINSTLF